MCRILRRMLRRLKKSPKQKSIKESLKSESSPVVQEIVEDVKMATKTYADGTRVTAFADTKEEAATELANDIPVEVRNAANEVSRLLKEALEPRLGVVEDKVEKLQEQPMYKFSQASEDKLSGVHPDLQKVMQAAIKVSIIDFGVSCGIRNKRDQDEAFRTGKSKVEYPFSKHNLDPDRNPDRALAVDIFAYVASEGGATWKLKYYYYLFGVITTVAKQLGIGIRHGLDFNQNGNYSDDSFLDGVHLELI